MTVTLKPGWLAEDVGGWSYLPDDHEICRKYPTCRWLKNGDGDIFGDSSGATMDPDYLGSLDAAVSLAERVMATEWPQWERHHRAVYSRPHTSFLVEITVPSREFRASHKVESIALCLATVRALIAKGGAGE